jgi:hypothetical protein
VKEDEEKEAIKAQEEIERIRREEKEKLAKIIEEGQKREHHQESTNQETTEQS